MINSVQDRLAAAEMIRNILDVGRAEDTRREIEARNLDANAMASPEQVGRRKDFDIVFVDFPRDHGSLRFAREWMPRFPSIRFVWIGGI